jgi:hypothetical protein
VNSARTLADRFRTQRADRIRVDSVEVLSLVEVDLAPDELVEVLLEQSRTDVDQALNLHSAQGDLVAVPDSEKSMDSGLEDEGLGFERITVLAPRSTGAALTGTGDVHQTLQLWNSWVVGAAHHAWTGNSGIVLEQLEVPEGAKDRIRLWCSDGLGNPQFDDLVAIVTVGPRQNAIEDWLSQPSSEEE